jgi:hypothetical protein
MRPATLVMLMAGMTTLQSWSLSSVRMSRSTDAFSGKLTRPQWPANRTKNLICQIDEIDPNRTFALTMTSSAVERIATMVSTILGDDRH